MARPVFSHPMVFMEEGAGARAIWGLGTSPPANPATVPPGVVAMNNATFSSVTAIYANVKDIDSSDYTPLFAIVRGGLGAGQSDVIVLATGTFVARYKTTADVVFLGGNAVAQFAVAPVVIKGTAPPVGTRLGLYIGLAATA